MTDPSGAASASALRDLPRISTGSEGLDDILGGGLDPNRMYLYEGRPGTGKTTIALQFLLRGARDGERVLYISLSETRRELELVAHRHGWSLQGVDIFELVPPETTLDPDRELTVFHPAEMELSETTGLIFKEVERLNPTRVVLDSLSELRLLAQNPLRYRRQVLALKHFFTNRNCTVVLLDDLSSSQDDLQLHSIAHGVVMLEQLAIDYGAERRRLRVIKMRGIRFRGGYHDFTISSGGLRIFPRLVAAEHHKAFPGESMSSGNAELDRLLGGGIERGTNVLLLGSAGVGKSSLALAYAIAAAERGEHAVFFAFDEGRGTIEARARTLGLPLQKHLDSGKIRFQQIDPAELSPGEFASTLRHSVEVDGARIVVIDSLNGYLNAMPDERFLVLQMHELLSYLAQQGVLSILILAQHGIVGPMDTPLDLSYLSDAVLMLRYFEFGGTVRRALSVVKKRSGNHEHTIREFRLGNTGIKLGPPLQDFSGIFSGNPHFTGTALPEGPIE
ncbi:circadian clock protein KaiC [Bradyrhizobium sp. WBOS7]|uniref:non-specific serine/threonine protein kinase n=1 Tax=Bradyrhizobium betae TaxID=244734 RepID=A0AAE9SS61_9BRAD|nr:MULTISPECIES: ATPase domain-containing protein [Bradyrhizobium]MDD1574184.1 circadian clock protein KaiC [Bradyrhizobium sp. WBOS1]UUO38547.1 circadian clock protein KaiC [Bradyrhizobium sp. WBOS01]MDD1530748.1 circadian clock protein KaiC [Bradyrhizobium sp. WBOS2]MDD1580149.1 circadian clock protein KaiC [Bradyrhizobium sp. WBOS7]MDD1603924.1 circadian clock protein KaiC [Bradyrhizobium sp. WBOS16]